jgi:hypothetical protein
VGCQYVRIGGSTVIVCGGRRPKVCQRHGAPATLECDWIIGHRAGKPLRCNAPLCDGCGTLVAPDKHLCPPHEGAWAAHPSNPANKPTPATST